ncbi:predicted protein [Sclerotinia sclerotiorum 1980 UF-70]|uniref:Uncharacterized protein n=2 Tax=Sclerotinia sclerotiorum (strain ATCC 18683 / 1980 / Ss-1) TaxID=665079 RepID=A7E4W5_SCLS1|nr:predicted protein [Sclerotinia sclerotiorum 1980 UF-70]APA08022.1 hypothetical protein sscle_03g027920 [Sclerotinia sclerotiorum 1980 UF-70]EDN90937.1 predicted protein [Sclerotinia sclerotiorum 1980 UF-70]
MEVNHVSNHVGRRNTPEPAKEEEVGVLVKQTVKTKELTFHPFLELPNELRDMVWGYGIDLTTSPSIVHMDVKHPNFPLLTHV